MIQPVPQLTPSAIDYPESDGLPMADNTKQLRWMFIFIGNLAALFRDRADVFVAGNQFWYPVEGHPEIVNAPDAYVVFGRPKGDRPSYRQWDEDNIPMTVVFEILSPKNTIAEMANKLAFYDDYGVEEYYIFDPDSNGLSVYLRRGATLQRHRQVEGFVSPRLGIRFDLSGLELMVYRPDGRQFLTFEQLEAQEQAAQQRADQAKQQADQAKQQADQAEQRADHAEQRADQAEQRFARLAELSRKARQQQASAAELAELEQLEQQPPRV